MPTYNFILVWVAFYLAILNVTMSIPSRLRRDNDDDDKYSSKEIKTEDFSKKGLFVCSFNLKCLPIIYEVLYNRVLAINIFHFWFVYLFVYQMKR